MLKIQVTGNQASGKTLIAKAIAKALQDQGVPASYDRDAGKRFDFDIVNIEGSFNPTEFATRSPDLPSDLPETIDAIRQWARDRNLINGSTPQAQTVKLFEEGGELAGGVARGKKDVIADSIGDMTVVLIILAAQCGLDFTDCVRGAYDEIKDRRGRMVDGVFIKDE